MEEDLLTSLSQLPDAELVTRLKGLLAGERATTAEWIAHLAELDTRDLHLRAGFGSLFVYCRDALALSESEAYHRIEVARAVRRFPLILGMLAEGSINLTSIRLLAPCLTPENHRTVLESARGKAKLQVEEIVARIAPRPDAPAFIRKLPDPRPLPELPAAAGMAEATSADALRTPPPEHRPAIAALAPSRYRLQVTIDGELLEKLRLAQDMLRHVIPTGDEAAILDRALTALLVDVARKKFAGVESPRSTPGTAEGSRHIPAEVKRAVWLRDLGRCAFMGEGGHRCGERGFLEFHHVKPYAVGGEATVENVQLRCRRHNHYEARAYFREITAARDGDPRRPVVPERVAPRLTGPA